MTLESGTKAPILSVKDLKKHYELRRFLKPSNFVKALDGVSFSLGHKRTLAVVGESGCGKSTLAKVLIQIEPLTSGEVRIADREMSQTPRSEFIKNIQMIFQDPYSSINPRKKAWQIISEPLMINSKLSQAECKGVALEMMAKVGLRPEFGNRYPHMFSGGQRQRIGIARALILKPQVMICDEPVSALDVSIQAQVINLLIDLQDQFGLSYVFISHDLSVVRHLADEVLVMYLGKVVEYGAREKIFAHPKHPYTQALLASAPHFKSTTGVDNVTLKGELPSPLNPPSGCPLHRRCPFAMAKCETIVPELKDVEGRLVSCHLY